MNNPTKCCDDCFPSSPCAECPVHSTPDKESDVVARFREKFAPRAQEFRGSRGYIVMNDIESFILGEIQAAREEERAAWAEREYKLLRDIERLVVERDALRTDLTN